jgi:hypothetical protein
MHVVTESPHFNPACTTIRSSLQMGKVQYLGGSFGVLPHWLFEVEFLLQDPLSTKAFFPYPNPDTRHTTPPPAFVQSTAPP